MFCFNCEVTRFVTERNIKTDFAFWSGIQNFSYNIHHFRLDEWNYNKLIIQVNLEKHKF